MATFAHLHVHTEYSILDGLSKIPELIQKAYNDGQRAMAITDHGNMFGIFTFVTEVEKFNASHQDDPFKAIIGCEVYVARRSRFDKETKEDRSGHHLVLLAKTWEGYRNLSRIVSLGYSEGFYYTPRVDKELLRKYSAGIIACSACLGGELPQMIMRYNPTPPDGTIPITMQLDAASKVIEEFKEIYGADYYLEMQRNGHKDQFIVNEAIKRLSEKHNVHCIATNDVHFVNQDDFDAHKMLICINTKKDFMDVDAARQDEDSDNGMAYSGEEFMRTTAEMEEAFSDFPEAIINTQRIADKIEVLKLKAPVVTPKFDVPEGFKDEYEYFEHLTYEGAEKRWDPLTDEIKQRLEFELSTVKKMGFPGYFLIVWDFINEGKKLGVRFGPGRGSAAGSAIAYCLGITNIDPIKYDLLFERFLNPDRISMPDIDVDMDDIGRGRVLQYVIDKYGAERVTQIITFGTLAAKSAVSECAKRLGLSVKEAANLTNLVPTGPKVTLESAFKEVPELAMLRDSSPDERIRKALKFAQRLEGTIRNRGVHACGVIIGRENLFDAVPLCTAKDSTMLVTEYEGKIVEDAGLLKMDFLGLKTLNIIGSTLENIKKRHNIDIDIDAIPLDDAKTYELFCQGETTAVFQFESTGMRKYLQQLKPNRFEDIIAMVSLYRPGPMDNIPSFIARKLGTEKIEYKIPEMAKYLDNTYGITVYQEQVMLLSQLLAGFTPGQADTLRKAMGKKQLKKMEELEGQFYQGGMRLDHKKADLEAIWTEWKKFASYAFNKSHATCYAFVSYQTAYLKAHYPAEFLAANMTNNLNNMDEITNLLNDANHLGIKVLGPDVNESELSFTVNKKGDIRFGLAGLKGVGASAVEDLIKEREENGNYENIFDFIQRINLRSCNKRCLEVMAQTGAFDSFGNIHRAQFFNPDKDEHTFIDKLITYGTQFKNNASQNQISIFDDAPEMSEMSYPEIPQCEPWHPVKQCKLEKEVAGFYISGHPLTAYRSIIENYTNANLELVANEEWLQKSKGRIYALVATVNSARTGISERNNEPYCFVTLEDEVATYDWGLFGENCSKFSHYFAAGNMLYIRFFVEELPWLDKKTNRRPVKLKPMEIVYLSESFQRLCKGVRLCLGIHDLTANLAQQLVEITGKYAGNVPFLIRVLGAKDAFHSDFFNYKIKVDPEKFLANFSLDVPYKLELL